MKNWWLQLSLREKQTVSVGAILLSLFLLYEMAFVVLSDAVTQLRQKIHTQQTLLTWMQSTNAHILALQKNPQPQATHHSSAALLGIIQESINNSPIAGNISQLQQADNDTVELQFQKINFDALTTWLLNIYQQQHVIITEMSITPDEPGMVAAELKLAWG